MSLASRAGGMVQLPNTPLRDVVARLTTHCFPWFERTSTTAGLLVVMLENHAKFDRPHAHSLFDIACCYAHLGQFTEARVALMQAITAYRGWYYEMQVF